MTPYINHVTLSTGNLTRSSRAEVADEVVAVIAPWLIDGIAAGTPLPLPVAALSHYRAVVIKTDGGGLVVTVYAPSGPHLPGTPAFGKGLPLVTLGVAQRSRHGADLWGTLVAQFGCAKGLRRPTEPWCAVALHAGLAAHREAAHWLGDLERCIAWAWITRQPALGAV